MSLASQNWKTGNTFRITVVYLLEWVFCLIRGWGLWIDVHYAECFSDTEGCLQMDDSVEMEDSPRSRRHAPKKMDPDFVDPLFYRWVISPIATVVPAICWQGFYELTWDLEIFFKSSCYRAKRKSTEPIDETEVKRDKVEEEQKEVCHELRLFDGIFIKFYISFTAYWKLAEKHPS